MRIALVHYTCLPIIAGVELVMAAHARLFAAAGHQVMMVAGSDGIEHGETVPGEPPSPGITHCLVPELLVTSEAARRVQLAAQRGDISGAFAAQVELLRDRLRPILESHRVVILHNVATMHFHLALTVALDELAAELSEVRFICWVHDLAGANPDYVPLLAIDREPCRRLAKANPHFTYVAVSNSRQRQFLQLTAAAASSCRVIPNGVDPARELGLPAQIEALAERHCWLDREIVLLLPARLLRRKNVELALRVTAALKAAGRSCACLITAPPDAQSAGSSDYETELRALHAALDLADEAFFLHDHGPLGSAEMRGLYALADALFLPSRQEGFGLPLLEAALHRLPIFCTDIEPLNSLLGCDVTVFASDNSPEKLAALAQQTLAANPAHRARRRVLQTYSWRAIYGNFLAPLLAETDTSSRL